MQKVDHKSLYNKNPWHCVPYGKDAPAVVNAIIEIPSESRAKYELDKDSGLLKLDRVLFSAVHYPANYGFIPQTYCQDGDPLDILVYTSVRVHPLCLMNAKVIGVMHMLDQGEADDKIIAVAKDDKSVSHIDDIDQMPAHVLEQIQRFFEDYKKMEKKQVKVGKIEPKAVALKVVQDAIKLYRETFLKQ